MASGDSCHTFNPSHRQKMMQSNQASVYASKYNWLNFQRCRASEVDSASKQALQEISESERTKLGDFKNTQFLLQVIVSFKLFTNIHLGEKERGDNTKSPQTPVLN